MLVVVLALAYLLAIRPTTKTDPLPPELVETTSPGASPAPAAQHPHDPYKEAMDRAHAAAKQMQAQHADADSF